jgi:hypothetical protein
VNTRKVFYRFDLPKYEMRQHAPFGMTFERAAVLAFNHSPTLQTIEIVDAFVERLVTLKEIEGRLSDEAINLIADELPIEIALVVKRGA